MKDNLPTPDEMAALESAYDSFTVDPVEHARCFVESLPLGKPLYWIVGSPSMPRVLCARLRRGPGPDIYVWGFSHYEDNAAFRTLGLNAAEWVAGFSEIHAYDTPEEAFGALHRYWQDAAPATPPQTLRGARKALGLTVQAAADKAGITRTYWTQVEQGHAEWDRVSLGTARAMAAAVNVPLSSLASPEAA